MNDSNVIIAALGGGRTTVTAKRYMTDYGQVLKITGVDLPPVYRVDFANNEHKGDYVRMIGNADGVLVPKQFFESGLDVWAFLVSATETAERTVAKIRIINANRPDNNVDPQPEPEEQDLIDTAIVNLNNAVQKTAADAERAEAAADIFTNASATAETLPVGSEATASYDDGLFTFGIPTGATGATGPQGPKGDTGDGAVYVRASSDAVHIDCDSDGVVKHTRNVVINLECYKGDNSLTIQMLRQLPSIALKDGTYIDPIIDLNMDNITGFHYMVEEGTEIAETIANGYTQKYRITATDGTNTYTIYENLTIVVVRDGAKGDNGDGAVYAVIGNTSSVIPVGTDGYLTNSYTINIPVTFYNGKDNVTGSVTSSDLYISRSSGGSGEMDTVMGSTYRNVQTATIQYVIPAGWRVGSGRITLTVTIGTTTLTYYHTYAIAQTGAQGIQGPIGSTGATPNLTIGTVTTLDPDDDATATITGTAENPVLNLGIPQGKTGEVALEDYYRAFPADTAQGAVASFSDGANLPVKSLVVDINPVQDLHGQESPYPAGGGKQLIPLTVENLKALNTAGSWGENVYTRNGITFDVKTNSVGSVTSIIVNGTSTAVAKFNLGNVVLKSGVSYTVTGFTDVAGTFGNLNPTFIGTGDSNISSKVTQTADSDKTTAVSFYVLNGRTVTNYTILPMVRVSSNGDDTFAPYSNICPISGHDEVNVNACGVNVWDEEWEVGAWHIDTGVKISGVRIINKNMIPVYPGQTLFLKLFAGATNDIRLFYYDKYKNYISASGWLLQGTATIPDDCHYINFYTAGSYGTTYNHDISINYPSTDHDYHPGTVASVEVQLGQTVYGGTLDVTNGVLTVDRAMVDLDDRTYWTKSGTYPGGFYISQTDFSSAYGMTFKTNTPFVCSHAKSVTYAGQYEWGCCFCDTSISIRIMQENATRYDWAEYLRAQYNAGTPVQVGFQLTEPITAQLTPHEVTALLGSNNIWADTGDSAVEYRADPTLYVQRKIAEAISALS